MDVRELAELVRQMRRKQSDYFARRHVTTLKEARDLERRVDKALVEVLDGQARDLFQQGRGDLPP
jgi:hypothetical protein